MKRFRKLLMVLALAVPMSFVPVKCAKATAAGDALLLVQQILQYVQDFDLGGLNLRDIEQKFDDLERIASWVSKGTSAYDTIRDISRLANKTERITKKSVKFYRYVASIEDDDLEMDRIIMTTRVCLNNIEYIYEGIGDVINMVKDFGGGANAKDIADAHDKALQEGEANLDREIDKTQDKWAEYVLAQVDKDLKRSAQTFDKLLIY